MAAGSGQRTAKRRKRSPGLISIYIGVSGALVLISLLIYIPIQYAYTYRVISNYVAEIDNNSLQQLKDRLTTGLAEMEQYMTNLAVNPTLRSLLLQAEADQSSSYASQQAIQAVNDHLTLMKSAYDDIFSIEIATQVRNYSSGIMENSVSTPFAEINRSGVLAFLAAGESAIGFLTPEMLDGFKNPACRFISRLPNDLPTASYLVFQMKKSWLDDLLQTNRGYTGLFRADSNRQAAYASDPVVNQLRSSLVQALNPTAGSSFIDANRQHYNLSWQTMEQYGFYFIFLQNLTDLLQPLDQMRSYAFLAVVLSLLSSAAFIWFFTRHAVSDLNKLQQQAKNYAQSGVSQLLPLKYRARSLHEETAFSLFLIMSLPLVVFSLLFNILSIRIIDKTKEDLIYLSLDKQVENVENFIRWNKTATERIMFDDTVQGIIKTVNSGASFDRLQLEQAISDNIMISTPLVIDFYDVNGRHFFTSQLNTQIAAPEIGEQEKQSFGEILFIQPEITTQGIRNLRFTRKIKNIRVTGSMGLQTIGYISCYYHESILADIIGESLMGSIYLCDNQQEVIFSDAGLTGPPVAQDAQNLVLSRKFAMNGWTLITAIPVTEFNQDHTLIFFFNATMVLLFCFLAFFISRMLSGYTVKPIIRLIEGILQEDDREHISGGGSKGDRKVFFPNELNELTYAFNKMTDQVKRVYDLEAEKNKAELQALQAQINPHFMYNTFESIRWMNKMGDQTSIDQMIGNLSDLFRLGISDEKKLIKLEEEVTYANAYLSIQKVRYGEQLNDEWQIDEKTRGIWMPKLILQPLIENAIYHGVRELEDTPGWIWISSRLEGERLILEIADNGPGMTPDKIRLIEDQLADPGRYREIGIGLSNVCRRLSFYYQDRFSLTIASEPYVRTSMILSLPVSLPQPTDMEQA